ncbi:MAG: hypothetical protein ABSC19_16785 [Syntrophorhabdales bacterium]|jgi:hypothetical protein
MIIRIMSKDGGSKTVDLNRRKAIHERCLNCVGWCSQSVNACDFDDCPLHPFRTGRGKQNAKGRAKAIREYCLQWCANGKIAYCGAVLCPLYAFAKSATRTIEESVSLPENNDIGGVFEQATGADG